MPAIKTIDEAVAAEVEAEEVVEEDMVVVAAEEDGAVGVEVAALVEAGCPRGNTTLAEISSK